MNNAFTKGKFKKWHESRFYKSCLTPNICYSKWLSMQPKKFQDRILGKDGGALFRGNIRINPFMGSIKLSLSKARSNQTL